MKWRTTIGLVMALTALAAFWEAAPRVNAQQDQPRIPRRGAASLDAMLSRPSGNGQEETKQVREGTLLSNQLGEFSMTGDRISFHMADPEHALDVLENLALERVWKVLKDTPNRQWSVSGTITEYRNRNYLLIQRAVLRVRGAPERATP